MRTLAVVCLLSLLATIAGAADPSQYVVTMPSPTATSIAVEAQLTLQGDVIAMIVHGSPQLINGQADLVEAITVTGADGRHIEVTDLGMGDWKLADVTAGERVTLCYRVRLAHGDYDWNAPTTACFLPAHPFSSYREPATIRRRPLFLICLKTGMHPHRGIDRASCMRFPT